MIETNLTAPLVVFAPNAAPHQGVVARFVKALGAPGRWLEARETAAQLALLSEREWRDIGAGERDPGFGYPAVETDEDRMVRRLAARAWAAPASRLAA